MTERTSPTSGSEVVTEASSSAGPSEFGRWLNETRTEKKLTVPVLAEKSGISFVQIYNIESGRSQNPRERTRNKLAAVLETLPPEEVVKATEEAAAVSDVGEFTNFDPHDKDDRPEEPGVYVLYDVSGRSVYVGQSETIKGRLNDHSTRFWFRAPVVDSAAYVRIDEESLRKKIEKLMIKFLGSSAVLNQQNVER